MLSKRRLFNASHDSSKDHKFYFEAHRWMFKLQKIIMKNKKKISERKLGNMLNLIINKHKMFQ